VAFHPYGYTIFCDDLRKEVGNKRSIIGVYEKVLYVTEEFPVAIPKLVLLTSYIELKNDHPDKVDLLVYLPGDEDEKPSLRAELVYSKVPFSEPNDIDTSDDTKIKMNAEITLSPLILAKEGKIKVRIQRGSEIIRAGALTIKTAPDVT